MAVLRFDTFSFCGVHDLLHDMVGYWGRRQKGKEEVRVEYYNASPRVNTRLCPVNRYTAAYCAVRGVGYVLWSGSARPCSHQTYAIFKVQVQSKTDYRDEYSLEDVVQANGLKGPAATPKSTVVIVDYDKEL